jgi:O-antigen ligase
VAIVIYSEYGTLLEQRLMTGFETGSAETVSSGRTAIWTSALQEMASVPISFVTGMGWEAYYQTIGHRLATHNVYLDRLYNLGLIGLTLFISLHIAAVFALRRGVPTADPEARPYIVSAIIGMISFMVAMLFTDLQGAATYMWAYVGLALRVVSSEHSALDQDTDLRGNNRRSRLATKSAIRPMSVTPK